MEYVYDIVLNFQDNYYDFYEWNKSDKLINIKKIPIYKISNQAYLEIKYHNVSIDLNTIPITSKIILLTSGIEVLGILLDKNGQVLKKSSLLFEESDDILENNQDLKRINIKYHINSKNKINILGRIKQDKLNYITNYLANIDKIKDEDLLKYLYYDIYKKEEQSIELIYNDILNLLNNDPSKLYDSIKRVDKELKKSFY